MNITVHRGTNQIGGCVTEYEHQGYRLFVDYGEQLPDAVKSEPLEIEGLTKGDLSKSAVLITHYHGDHIGCIKYLPKELPIYMGEVGMTIQLTLSKQLSYRDKEQNIIIERLQAANSFKPGSLFQIGPFRIMPVNIDHSAFDAYAFKIEAGGITILHTGDFRMHGFRSGKFEKMVDEYIRKNVDYIVCEGTNISRPNSASLTEREVQEKFKEALKQKRGHIVYLSSTNIDRLFSLYHAALEADIPFCVDKYQKEIMDDVTSSKSLWTKASLYQYGKRLPMTLQPGDYPKNAKLKYLLDTKGYVLIARTNQMFDRLIEELPGEKVKYLSMWDGYLDEKREAYNEALAKALGKDWIPLHTSGHCDMNDMRKFFTMLQPKGIIPIHTDRPDEFAKLFGDEWHVIRLRDGEPFTPAKEEL